MLALLAAIPPPPIDRIELGPLDIRMYGLLIAIGAYLALRVTVSRYERLGGNPELAEKAALVAIGAGFLGARIGYVIPRVDRFAERPLAVFAIWEGGLALFGGLALGVIVTWWYVRRRQGDVPAMADAIAPALPLAQALGRWGNYFNQELYGRPTDLPWALHVEPPFRRPGFESFATFHPTFLYESVWNLALIGALLWIDRRGRLRRGSLGLLYLIGYGVGRFWVEYLRIDTAERYFGLSRNNWVALGIILAGVVGLVLWERRRTESDTAELVDDSAHGDSPDDDSGQDDQTAGVGTAESVDVAADKEEAAGDAVAADVDAPEDVDGPEDTDAPEDVDAPEEVAVELEADLDVDLEVVEDDGQVRRPSDG